MTVILNDRPDSLDLAAAGGEIKNVGGAGSGRALPWVRLVAPAEIGSASAIPGSAEADYITETITSVEDGYMYKEA